MSDAAPFWERLVLAIASTVIAAALVGMWVSIVQFGEVQAVMQSQVKDVRSSIRGVYTRSDADRDFAAVFKTDSDQYDRLDDHEQRIRKLEVGCK